MDFFPIFLNIRNKSCLVVGGGNIAARKADLLRNAHANVTIVAPDTCDEMAILIQEHRLTHVHRPFEEQDIVDHCLIIAATDNPGVNAQVAELAKQCRVPVNVIDDPKLGSFITPSIIDRSPIQIAVSTGGASPVLARMLRTRLETLIPSGYGRLGRLVSDFREAVKMAFPKISQRRHFWEKVLEGSVAELAFSKQDAEARKLLEKALDEAKENPDFPGEVYLVGSGPGDPDLLTFRALRLMQQADVVVYDRLVSPPILDMVRRDAEHIYVGKARADHAVPQENINQLLVRLAKEGKRVLRLKGGDPFIFGRGGEEIETLIEEGIAFQVVPGITAASGCSTYSGIPLTHRDYSQAAIFVTGHLKDGTININWDMLSHANQTVVFYMGLQGIQVICDQLVAHGRDIKTPAALIEKGTTPEHKVYIGDLSSLPDLVKRHNVKAPTLIIVGEVVDLHHKLHWFKPEGEIEAGTESDLFAHKPAR